MKTTVRVEQLPIPLLAGLALLLTANFGPVWLFDRIMSRYVKVTDV